jgi:hypothetical protein
MGGESGEVVQDSRKMKMKLSSLTVRSRGSLRSEEAPTLLLALIGEACLVML